MEVVIFAVCAVEVKRFLDTPPQPITVAVGAGRRPVETGRTGATRNKIAIDDAIPFSERLAGVTPLRLLSQANVDAPSSQEFSRSLGSTHVPVNARQIRAIPQAT